METLWLPIDRFRWPLGERVTHHVITVCLLSQSALEKHSREKPTNLCTLWISPKLCLPCLIILQSCYFDKWNKQTFCILSLHDLHFMLCSLDLNIPCAQRIMGFFILITHKSMRSENLITRQSFSVMRVSAAIPRGRPLGNPRATHRQPTGISGDL